MKCSIEQCDRDVKTRGLCGSHYKRLLRHGDPLGGTTANGAPLNYLNGVVISHQDMCDCLIWPYGRKGKGYAQITVDGKNLLVTRIICERLFGPPPTEEHVAAHSCGRGHDGCVNPKHLRWATKAENSEDSLHHGTRASGERHGAAKLTKQSVAEIRDANKSGETQRSLARRYEVSAMTINDIISGITWRHENKELA